MLSSSAYYFDAVSGMPDIMRNRITSLRTSITEFVGEMMASFSEVSSVEGVKVRLSPHPSGEPISIGKQIDYGRSDVCEMASQEAHINKVLEVQDEQGSALTGRPDSLCCPGPHAFLQHNSTARLRRRPRASARS